MMTSHRYKFHWWGIGANGSASMSWALNNIFNVPYEVKDLNFGRRNSMGDDFWEDYDILVNARNPYEWIVASLFDLDVLDSFDEYLRENLMNVQCVMQVKMWEDAGVEPTHFIRCEDMYGSLLKLPRLKEGIETENLSKDLMSAVNTPDYDKLGKGRNRLVASGWKQYWNQELVDFILENKYVNRLFEAGYDKESWK